jgi:hypothetical protein
MTMRAIARALSTAGVWILIAAPVSAQQTPSFSGQWQREDRNDLGSGWGDVITVTQNGSRLQVEYALFAKTDMQPPLRLVYDLEGRETENKVMMGRGVQTQTSHARLVDGRLSITTSHELAYQGRPVKSDVQQVLSLESPTTLIVEVTRAGVLGGPPTSSRSVYRKVAGT